MFKNITTHIITGTLPNFVTLENHAALDAMRRQGRSWQVKPFQRHRRTA